MRKCNGTPTTADRRDGGHMAAVSPDEFDRVQSILRNHYKAPRPASSRLRPYLLRGLANCWECGEKAWYQHINKRDYYRESSPDRGIACGSAGRYWSASQIDSQVERLLDIVELPETWQQRALELANSENNLLDLRNERLSLETRRRRIIELTRTTPSTRSSTSARFSA